jgi:hypothetical protein
VRAALIADGMAADRIDTVGKGEHDVPVTTKEACANPRTASSRFQPRYRLRSTAAAASAGNCSEAAPRSSCPPRCGVHWAMIPDPRDGRGLASFVRKFRSSPPTRIIWSPVTTADREKPRLSDYNASVQHSSSSVIGARCQCYDDPSVNKASSKPGHTEISRS